MGLRDRVRKTFKKKDGSSSSGGSTPSTSSDPNHYTGRTDIEYYKPHEIPKSKYRGKVCPDHKERLDSYSFGGAFQTVRRKSSQALSGIMSPGGTKSQSRRPSYMSHMSRASKDIRPTALHDDTDPVSRVGTSTGNPPAVLIRENSEDDTNVQNTGTTKPNFRQIENSAHSIFPAVKRERHATLQEQPFTVADLEQAMTRATLRTDGHESFHRSSMAIAAH